MSFIYNLMSDFRTWLEPKCDLFPLPEDGLYQNIFSSLNFRDIQNFACVSKDLSKSIIKATTSNEIRKIQQFVSELLSKLKDQMSEQVIKDLEDFKTNCQQYFESVTLLSFAKSAPIVMRRLLTILKNIDGLENHWVKYPPTVAYKETHISNIKYHGISIPQLFRKIIDYAIIYNITANQMNCLKIADVMNEQQDDNLLSILICAAENGDFDVAIGLKKEIFDDVIEVKAWSIIAREATKKGNYQLSLQAAEALIIRKFLLKVESNLDLLRSKIKIYEEMEQAIRLNGDFKKAEEIKFTKEGIIKEQDYYAEKLKAHIDKKQEQERCQIQ